VTRTGARRAKAFATLTGVAGAAALAVSTLPNTGDLLRRPGIAVSLVAALALSWVWMPRMLHRDETEGLLLDEAFFVAAVLALPGATVVAVFALGITVGCLLMRRGAVRSVFNIGQSVVAASAGVAVAQLLGLPSATVDPRSAMAAVAGAAAYMLVQTTAVSTVIALAEGRPVRSVLASGSAMRMLVWVGNVSVGLLAGLALEATPWALAFAVLPIVVLRLEFTAHLQARRDRERMNGLFDAAVAAYASMGTEKVQAAMMEAARSLLRCDEARLSEEPPAGGELAVPVRTNEGTHWLAVAGRRGVDPHDGADRALLEAIAAVGAGALQNATLYRKADEERRKLAEILASSSDGILTLDADGRVTSWNPAMEAITGLGAAQMLGAPLSAGPTAPDGAPACRHLGEVTAGVPADVPVVTTSGETRWLSCSAASMAEGGLVMVARDVTRARELDRLRDDFVGTISHELRTPLTPIKGWAATLARFGPRLDPEVVTEAVGAIATQADRLERLLTNLLEVARIDNEGLPTEDQPVDVSRSVAKVVEEFRTGMPDRAINFTVPIGCTARGDELHVEQVVSNLLSNAMKYAPASEPVEVEIARTADGVEIRVADHGPGIPAADAERIFERFRRLGEHMTRPEQGAGLGLYIARRFAQAMGGSVTLTDTPGGGATFCLRLRDARGQAVVHATPAGQKLGRST
jgi:PAS domain S-box-containing protein